MEDFIDGITEFSKNLKNLIEAHLNKNHKILLVSHENTDFDGFAAVITLSYLIKTFFKAKSDLIYPFLPNLNKTSKNLFDSWKINDNVNTIFNYEDIVGDNYLVLILDTNKFEGIRNFSDSLQKIKEIIIIDHHQMPSYLNGDYQKEEYEDYEFLKKVSKFFIYPKASSCSEIIASIWNQWDDIFQENKKLNNNFTIKEKNITKLSQLLLVGIFSDSGNLRYSRNFIIPIINFLIKKGADISIIRETTKRIVNIDEKIARIKGAIRSIEPDILDRWIILFTNVNSFEASVCRGLLDLGADVVFCLSRQKHEEFRIIVRSSDNFQLNTDVNFGTFMDSLGLIFDGHGGGHKGAAGMNGKNCPNDIKNIVISKLKEELKKI